MSKFLTLMLAVLALAACTNSNEKMSKCVNDTWDKVFPLSETVSHKKVSFQTQYGFTLVGDLYWPNDQINDPYSEADRSTEGRLEMVNE